MCIRDRAIIVHIELIDPIKQAQDSRAELSCHSIFIQVAVQMLSLIHIGGQMDFLEGAFRSKGDGGISA